MNARTLFAAASLILATAGAQAQEAVSPDHDFVSVKTRAEVIAELRQAQADGSYAALNSEAQEPARFESLRTLSYANAAQSSGVESTAPALNGKTRAQVIADLEEYKRRSPLGDTDSSYHGHFGG